MEISALSIVIGIIMVNAIAATTANDFMSTLTSTPTNSNAYQMTPVHMVVARVQSDMPVWSLENDRFVSSFASTAENQFLASLDTVNATSVEGVLMYVQAQGINYKTRSTEDRCTRNSNMAYIVFYEMAIVQANETLTLFQDTADVNEYGPMVPMSAGQCTPLSDDLNSEDIPVECHYFNGTNGEPNIGPFVGAKLMDTAVDPRAPYPNNLWYSFPNSCPLKTWNNKTEGSRATTRYGLCDMDVMPDGVNCTYNYRLLGFLSLDDLVGITSMVSSRTDRTYTNFTEFCKDGRVEFEATTDGEWIAGISFWENPLDKDANVERVKKVLEAYANLTKGHFKNTPLDDNKISRMLPLPTPEELTAENPPCYLNVKKCNSEFGCKRELYSQMCTICTSPSDECVTAPSGWMFPILAKSVGENGGTGARRLNDSSFMTDLSSSASSSGSRSYKVTLTSSGLSSGTTAPIATGSIVGAFFLMYLVCFYQRWRKIKASQKEEFDAGYRYVKPTPTPTPATTDPPTWLVKGVPPTRSVKRVNRPTDSSSNLWDDEAIISWRVPREKVKAAVLVSRGGYGEVYKGTYNGQDVAIKMLLPETRRSVQHVNAFLAEVKMIAGLEHTRIVEFIGVAWDSFNDLCVLSEFMASGDLRVLLSYYDETNEPQGFDYEKVKIALHVAHALTYLHSLELPVIHRDLKSKNVLLTPDLDAKLTDFGVSRERIDATMTAGVGTSLWMAPEVMLGEKYDVAADMFSFGVLLSELDTQKLPYSNVKDRNNAERKRPQAAILQMVAMGSLSVEFTAGALSEMVKLGSACVLCCRTQRLVQVLPKLCTSFRRFFSGFRRVRLDLKKIMLRWGI